MREGKRPPINVYNEAYWQFANQDFEYASDDNVPQHITKKGDQFIKNNCLTCPLRNMEYLVFATMTRKPIDANRICDSPGTTHNQGGYCSALDTKSSKLKRVFDVSKAIWEAQREV